MFEALIQKGLKPNKVALIGKCYSTCPQTLKKMSERGMFVSPSSIQFDSHQSYDDLFEEYLFSFLKQQFEAIQKQSKRLIILDDGGALIHMIATHFSDKINIPMIGIEQTSSGYNILKSNKISFPIINIARSNLKLKHETPFIVEALENQIYSALKDFQGNILIIGKGIIGTSLFEKLSNKKFKVQAIDKKEFSDPDTYYDELKKGISKASCIIGCTGTTSIPEHFHKYIKKDCILISASSTDREFDSVHIRKHEPQTTICHKHIKTSNKTLMNSGFPVNFTGETHSVAPEKIQLTRALIMGAIYQALYSQNHSSGLIDLDESIQDNIYNNFQKFLKNGEKNVTVSNSLYC
ncbi:MAG TPA: hypothetical protein P5048_03095 [Chlamydiales bacterium]|nr:hypothetical protein [Chlamydiales bacterium]